MKIVFQLRAIMGNRDNVNAPFIAVSEHMKNSYDVCTNEEHTVSHNDVIPVVVKEHCGLMSFNFY